MSAEKTTALAGGAAQGSDKNGKTHGDECSSASADHKAFATLQAQFSLKGWGLLRLADGVMLAERWGCLRQLDTLAQAAQFLHQIGGR
ncbi:MAG: hypothetical protein K2W93_08630 [Burkholderiaceae bacterium]|nr:hypothetical protein [Burkholderiaceae bacterium]